MSIYKLKTPIVTGAIKGCCYSYLNSRADLRAQFVAIYDRLEVRCWPPE